VRTVQGSNSTGCEAFSFIPPVPTGPEAHPASSTMRTRTLFPRVQRPGRVVHKMQRVAPQEREYLATFHLQYLHLHHYNSMQQSSTREAHISSGRKDIPRIYGTRRFINMFAETSCPYPEPH